MIAQCSSCGRTFQAEDRGPQYCPHCGTHVYLEVPGSSGQEWSPHSEAPPPAEGPEGHSRPGEGEGPWSSGGSEAAPPGGSPPHDWQPPPHGGGPPPPPGQPPGGGGAFEPGGEESPFERRDRLGFVAGFFETVKQALIEPGRLFRNMRVDNVKGAFLFGWLCVTIGYVANNFWNYLVGAVGRTPSSQPDVRNLPPEIAEALQPLVDQSASLLWILLAPLFAVVWLFVAAGLIHLGAMLFGAAGRGWNASFRAVCYGAAPNLIAIVPFCGAIIGGIWNIVLTIVALYFLQRTTPLRASFSVLIWYLLCCFCVCGGMFIMAGAITQVAGM